MSNRSPDGPGASQPPDSPRSPHDRATSDRADLVGRRIVASIGEPWDFTSAAGDNFLTGQIVARSSEGEPVEWLICEVSPFMTGTAQVSSVATVRRHAGDEPIQQLQQRGEAYVHLLYDPSGAPLTASRVSTALRTGHDNLEHLIGSVRLSA
jgi:hypothetical protein